MQPISIQDLINFILLAKQATYVGGGNKLLPYRLGSHDLQFFKDDWASHDSYLGERCNVITSPSALIPQVTHNLRPSSSS